MVTAQLPGADAQTVASTVTTPLERQFGQIPGLTQMTSSSGNESSTITLQFARSTSVDFASQAVQAAINAAAGFLPADANSADLSAHQSGRYAGADAGIDLGDAAAHDGQRLREQHSGSENFANAGRWTRQYRRPAESGDPGAGEPGVASCNG